MISDILHEGWKEVELGTVLKRIKKPVSLEFDSFYREIGIRSHGKGIFHKEERTGASIGEKSVFWVEPNCFVVNIVFAWEQAVAKTTIHEKGMIASHRFPMYKPVTGELDLDYLVYFFNSARGKYLLGLASPGGAGRNKTLGQEEFLRLIVPLPAYEKQLRIVEILNTWSEAISLTEELITEKQLQKKVIMSKIIKKEIRFQGFETCEWTNLPFNKIYETISARKNQIKNSEIRASGKYPVIDQGQNFIAGYTNEEKLFDEIPVIIFGDHTRVTKYLDFPFVVGADGTKTLKTKDGCDILFGYYLLSANVPPSMGYSRHFKELHRKTFSLPVNIDEQIKIAAVLQAIDIELDLLTQKHKILNQQKTGLMQKLLTGQIRVKV
jgi:type I restriction enzyme S subunit